MTHDYRLKRKVPRKFIVLSPEQYELKGGVGNVLRVHVTFANRTMVFWLSRSGQFFINSGCGRVAERKNDKGEFVTYAIPVEAVL